VNEIPLFVVPAVMHLDCTYVEGVGWNAGFTIRMQGQSWAEAERSVYERLSHSELTDVIAEHVITALGIV